MLGNLIEVSGTMSGGGGRPKTGLMGQQVSYWYSAFFYYLSSQVAKVVEVDPRELQTMERGITEVQTEVDGYSRRRNQLDEKIHTLKNTLKLEQQQQRKLAVEVNPLKEMIQELEGQVRLLLF